jgi:thiaminase
MYLDSWAFAATHLAAAADVPPDAPIRRFVANWTGAEFAAFVADLGALVDGLGVQPGTPAWARAERVWARVVELEAAFWPEAGEEEGMRAVDVARSAFGST